MTDATTILRGLIAWAVANPDLMLSLVALLTGGVHSARTYRRTGRFPLADLPWHAIRRLGYALRKRFFTTPMPSLASLGMVVGDLETVRTRLGRQSYEPAWPLSYRYKKEDLNARRYYFDPDRRYPHRQIHVRGWALSDGSVKIDAHEEPSPLQHPRAHLRETDMHDATEWVTERYDNGNGLDPRGFEP